MRMLNKKEKKKKRKGEKEEEGENEEEEKKTWKCITGNITWYVCMAYLQNTLKTFDHCQVLFLKSCLLLCFPEGSLKVILTRIHMPYRAKKNKKQSSVCQV